MNHKFKRLGLALAIALGSTQIVAAEMDNAESAKLRQELREAKEQLAEVSKRVAELSMKMGGDPARVEMFRFLGDPDRAVIGVILGEGGKNGVTVQGVTPGGPADKAGLRAGDLITAVRGASISGDRSQMALRESLKGMKDGDKVKITASREGRSFDSEIVAARQGTVEFSGGPGARAFFFDSKDLENFAPLHEGFDQEIETIVERALGDAPHEQINIMTSFGMGGLRLSSMNDGLGRYFGVNEGALVLEVNGDKYAGLQPGDVILEIDGKAVKDPREAMRELGRQDSSRQVELKLQRDRVPQLVKVTVPEKHRILHELIKPTSAPAAPEAPAPQASWTERRSSI